MAHLTFKQYLREGGNVVIGDQEAQRIDLEKLDRSKLVPSLGKSLAEISKAMKRVTGFELWSPKLLRSGQFLSGSALHFFDTKGISDKEFVGVKPSVGDIDTQVDGVLEPFVEKFLKASRGKTYGKLKLIGFKKSAGQFITLWQSDEFGINIQIDLELVAYKNGRPTPWSVFSHSSAWEDMQKGIKGVAHKYIFRALNAKDLQEIIIQPKTSRGREKVVTSAEMAFSLSGLRQKLTPVLDQNGNQVMKQGKPVYQEVDSRTAHYVTELGAIFNAFFGHEPSPAEEKQMFSFTGVLNLISKNFNRSQQQAVADGFVNTLWGPRAQSLYRTDPERDLTEKSAMVAVMAKALNMNPKQWDPLMKKFYS